MTLYEINEQIVACIDEETGEVDVEKLCALELKRTEKIENIALWVKELKADAAAIKAEEQALKARRESKEKKAESLTKYLSEALSGERFETPKTAITFRHSKKVEITDFTALDDDFLRYSEPTPDKKKIGEALKAGIEVKGAQLVDNISMTVK